MNDLLGFLTNDWQLLTSEQCEAVGDIYHTWARGVDRRLHPFLRFPDWTGLAFSTPGGKEHLFATCWFYSDAQVNRLLTWVEGQVTDWEGDFSADLNRGVLALGLRQNLTEEEGGRRG